MKAVFAFFNQHYRWQLPFSSNPELLLKDLKALGVEKAFSLAYTHKPGLARSLNSWLADFCSRHPWIVPFGAVHPLDDQPKDIAVECLDYHRFPGMKLHCLVQQCRPDDERLFPLYEAIIERDKGVIIHAGSFPQPVPEHLGITYVARLLRRYPKLKLVVPHLGLHDLSAYSALLGEYKGLYLDTAFVFQNRGFLPPAGEIEKMIYDHPDRIIYGSDYPFILEPPQNGIKRINELGLPPNIYRRLFRDNAFSFLDGITRK